MRYAIRILSLLIILSVWGCSTTTPPTVLTEDNLPADVYVVRTGRDTSLLTPKGTIIRIPEGALRSATGSVRLAIKEAYTMKDMMLAGLVTKAGGKPLSSGGMINISVDGSEQVTIAKPIEVSVPARVTQPGMQLYQGVVRPDGSIDWTDPQPLQPAEQDKADTVISGEVLFNTNCASCHHATKESTGPPLAFLAQRREKEWLCQFVWNSSAMIAATQPLLNGTEEADHIMVGPMTDTAVAPYRDDGYARCIYEYYNRTAMTAFPQLSRDEVMRIFEYVDGVAKDVDPATIRDYKAAFDSCKLYNSLVQELTTRRKALIADNDPQENRSNSLATNVPTSQTDPDSTLQPAVFDASKDLVTPVENGAEYYKFSITTFGWYNVDILMKGLPGFEESELMVRITGTYSANIDVFMALPRNKILLDGGLLDGKKDTYGFYTKDGKIPLPQGEKMVLFAVGAEKEQLYFGDAIMTTSRAQFTEIKMRPATRQEIDSIINGYQFEGVDFATQVTKNAKEIKRIDSALEVVKVLKPANWDCDCAGGRSDTSRWISGGNQQSDMIYSAQDSDK